MKKSLVIGAAAAGIVAAMAYNKRKHRFDLDTLRRRSATLLDTVERYGREFQQITKA